MAENQDPLRDTTNEVVYDVVRNDQPIDEVRALKKEIARLKNRIAELEYHIKLLCPE